MSSSRSLAVLVAVFAIALAPLFVAAQTENKVIRNETLNSQRIRDSDIMDTRVVDSDLYGVHLRGATVNGSRLENVAITNATVRTSTVLRASLYQVTIEDSNLTSTWIESGTVRGGSLSDSAVRAVRMENVRVCNVLIVAQARIDNSGCGDQATPGGPPPTTGVPPPPTSQPGPSTPAAGTSVFATDDKTLARFEFNGDASDASGNGRPMALIGGATTFTATKFGQGLRVAAEGPALDWSANADLLRHPFTVELVFSPDVLSGYRKLFSPNDAEDPGWYIQDNSFRSYSAGAQLGGDRFAAGQQAYLAMVSTSADQMDVYLNGARLDATPLAFTAPPAQAMFFRDDSGTSRREQFEGVVDAIRISNGARTAAEIGAVQARLAG